MKFQKPHVPEPGDRYARARDSMTEEIRAMGRETGACVSEDVLSVMKKVPRHLFIPENETWSAYCNIPLPIGHGQTISQPYIVALMTQLLAPTRADTVLEVGTGSGYQTAILAEMAGKVLSVEILAPLAARATGLLGRLGYGNVRLKVGDGSEGWKKYSPFDGIMVTAAADHVPQRLLDQLKSGGRMVIPVGGYAQALFLITKTQNGVLRAEHILPVSFVPLIGAYQKNRLSAD